VTQTKTVRHRLLRTQRRQGDARRQPSFDRHRRRPGANVPLRRTPRRGPQSRGGLGHAVCDVDRTSLDSAKATMPRSRSATSTPSTKRPARSSTPTIRSRSARARAWSRCSRVTPRRCVSWRVIVDQSIAYLDLVYETSGHAHSERRVGESFYNNMLSDVVTDLRRRGSDRRERRRAVCLSSGLHQPRRRGATTDRSKERRGFRLRRE